MSNSFCEYVIKREKQKNERNYITSSNERRQKWKKFSDKITKLFDLTKLKQVILKLGTEDIKKTTNS